MHPGPEHKPIVFGVSRSKVKVTKVKFDFFSDFTKIAITSLILVVETRAKNQNVQEDELYNTSMINRKYR